MHEYSVAESVAGGGGGLLSKQSMIDDAASDYQHKISTLGRG